MKTRSFLVRVHNDSYPFVLGSNLEQELQKVVLGYSGHRIAIIADTTVAKLWGKEIVSTLKKIGRQALLLPFTGGERNKNQKTVTALQHELLKRRFGRDTLIVALGGGVTGDIAGFVASTVLRGIPFIQIPTTLLAGVDSSVGGKVGIDTPYGKNLIGQFHQPRAVISDMRFLSTLPKQHIVNGLFEAIKLFIISDKESLGLVAQLNLNDPLTKPTVLREIIWRSVRGKALVVKRDEHEKNERKTLNFGHTIGHALELISEYRLLHGFGVAYGMLVETKISELLGILSAKDGDYIRDCLASFGIHGGEIRKYRTREIIAATRGDKKIRGGKPHYVLLESIGSVHIKAGQYAHPVTDAIVKEALRAVT